MNRIKRGTRFPPQTVRDYFQCHILFSILLILLILSKFSSLTASFRLRPALSRPVNNFF